MFVSLNQLRATIPDGSVDNSALWRMDSDDEKPCKAETIDITKPCVFYFGGDAYYARSDQTVPREASFMRELLTPVMAPTDYHFYSLTHHKVDKASEEATVQKAMAYNNYPKLFFSAEAEAFVARHLMPLVPNTSTVSYEERERAIATAARNFSAITFLGFSYGGCFIQQISNALNLALDKKGYSNPEKNRVMHSLAAVNIGPSFKYTPKYPDLAQTTFVLANDKKTVVGSGISLSNEMLEFTTTSHGLSHAQNGAHTLVYAKNTSSRLRDITYRNAPQSDSLAELIGQAQNWTETAPSQSDKAVINDEDLPPHNKPLQMASLRWNISPETIHYTFPSNLIGTNSVRFLQNAVKASARVVNEGRTRDTVALNQQCVAAHLNDDALERDIVQTRFYKQLFDHLGDGFTR